MSDFEALKQHLVSIMRELDQVQESIKEMQGDTKDNAKDINELKIELTRIKERVEVLMNMLRENKKLIYYIIGVCGFGYGFARFIGLEEIMEKMRGN